MPPTPKATRSKSKGRNQETEPPLVDSNVASTDSATKTTASAVVITAPITAVTANISVVTTAPVTAATANISAVTMATTAVSSAQVAASVANSAISTVATTTIVSANVTTAAMPIVTSSDQSSASGSQIAGINITTSSQNTTALTAVTSSSSAAPIMSVVVSSDQSEYDVSGLSPSLLGIWNKCSKEEKDSIEFLRGNLEYIRSSKRSEFLTNYLEKRKITVSIFAILSQMASTIAATQSEVMSICGEDYNPQLTDCDDGSELGAVGGSIPPPVTQSTQQIDEVVPVTAQIAFGRIKLM